MVVWLKPCKSRSSPGASNKTPLRKGWRFSLRQAKTCGSGFSRDALPSTKASGLKPLLQEKLAQGVAELLAELLGEFGEGKALVLRAEVLDLQRPHQRRNAAGGGQV